MTAAGENRAAGKHRPSGKQRMRDLVEFIAKSLVDDPTQVRVTQTEGLREVRIELRVAEEDLGRVIGRNGRVANSIRSLMRVIASRKGVRSSLDIV